MGSQGSIYREMTQIYEQDGEKQNSQTTTQ